MTKNMLRGRFEGHVDKIMQEFGSSIDVDSEMISEDIWGNCAHTIMLCRQGIISSDDAKKILSALEKAQEDYDSGKLKLDPYLEDVHMNIEAYVTKLAGKESGGKLHTARSRNDQVQTDIRLHLRKQIKKLEKSVICLQLALLDIAEENIETVMPGYTHTQQAQPITLAYWACTYVSMLNRDLKRLISAYDNVNQSPLGACAFAGSSFPTDRELTAKLLGFEKVLVNSMDAVSSRDYIAEAFATISIIMSNLSRLSEEMINYSTKEYGMLELSDQYSTGSSIMPQKKNPDPAELVRGMTGFVYGGLVQILTTLKGLPLAYNRDLQEDRSLLWTAIHKTNMSLNVLTGALSTAKFNTERMLELADSNFSTATELANYLAQNSHTFREAHEITGSLVKALSDKNEDFCNIELSSKLLKANNVDIPPEKLKTLLDAKSAVRLNRSLGGTSPKEVRRMIESQINEIKAIENQLKAQKEQVESARGLTDQAIKEILEQ